MLKGIFVAFVSFGLIASAWSQHHVDQAEILYMEDGSIYMGRLIGKELPKNFLLSTGDTISIDLQEVQKRKLLANVNMYNRGSFHFKTGYFGYVYGGGGGSFSGGASHFSGVVGKRLNGKVSVGAGISLDYYNETVAGLWVDHSFTTVFGYGRYYLAQTKTRLYVDSRLGYAMRRREAFVQDHSNGVNFQPGIGIHFASKGKVKFHLNIARSMQFVAASNTERDFFTNSTIEVDYRIWHSHTVFTLGIEAW